MPAVVGINQRLGAERPYAAFGVRAERPDREEARRDGYAERTARITRYD